MNAIQRRKKFGQVFTPETIAALMADWVMAPGPKRVLDPAFGKGALAAACLDKDRTVEVAGYEIDPIVLDDVPADIKEVATIQIGDFLQVPTTERFEAIIANPPYIRHRELNGHAEVRMGLSHASGCEIPKSANLYVDFLVKATLHLDDGGRAAYLIPAEWMSANFSAGLKKYLVDSHFLHSLVTFSNCSNIFGDALTTASLVLLEKATEPIHQISSYFVQSIDATDVPRTLKDMGSVCKPRNVSTRQLRAASKWEPILRGDLIDLPTGWITLGEVATTRRGIATGANAFFLISETLRDSAKIDPHHVLPCIGRSNDVEGLVFAQDDFEVLNRRDARVWLVNFSTNLTEAEQTYVAKGESQEYHKRYLTKSRRPWHTMEQRNPAPVWASVFGRGDLRFVHNDAGARSLTNFHCVYPVVGGRRFAKALVAILNSRSVRNLMISHQRGYGGGLNKFEPKDLLSIPIPDLRTLPEEMLDKLAEQLDLMHTRQRDGVDPSTPKVEEIISTIDEESFRLVG